MSFTDLGLDEALLAAVARTGYTQATPIQAQAIPALLEGRDVLAAAQTGTGKTAAFALPILQKLAPKVAAADPRGSRLPRALVLTPTRELAAQVGASLHEYGQDLKLRGSVVFGGVAFGPQAKKFARGVDYLVATPGRLLDHASQGTVNFAAVEILVLDEADRMLDMGFIHDIKRIIQKLPQKRQNLLFSATFSQDIRKLAKTLLNNPQEIEVAPRNAPAELVDQQMLFVPKAQKHALLAWLIGSRDWKQVLVFTRTKHGANRLVKQLESDGLTAAALHGNKSQSARTKALDAFKRGNVRVLVATDIAARGIDIDALPHVINYELPNVPEDYVHRIGRTGRAGSQGQALSLVGADERPYLKDIQKLLGRSIPQMAVEGFVIGKESDSPAPRDKPASKPRPHSRPNGNSRGRGNAGAGRDGNRPPAKPGARRKRSGGGGRGNAGGQRSGSR